MARKAELDFTVDEEFEQLLPRLSEEGRQALEASILAEGCRDPVVVWQEEKLLLDGHNRIEICDHYEKPYTTEALSFADRDEAKRWIFRNARGRRNLTPLQLSYIRGAEYELRKTGGHGAKAATQNGSQNEIADTLSGEQKVSKNTIKRDAFLARDVNTIADVAGPDAKELILSGDIKLTRAKIQALAGAPIDQIIEAFADEDDPIDAVKKLAAREVKKTKKPPKPPKWDRMKADEAVRKLIVRWRRAADSLEAKQSLLKILQTYTTKLEKEVAA